MSKALDVASVSAALANTRFAGLVDHAETTGSTNALALAAAQGGRRSGVWTADEQTAGRGRGGHTWHSPPGDGLYVSVLATPRISSPEALLLSFAAGLAAQDAIHSVAGLDVDIRWPNDLILRDRKCGGILVEAAMEPVTAAEEPALLRYAVIGIGINVEHTSFPEALAREATSLRREAGHLIGRERLLIALLQALDRELSLLEHEAARAPGSASSLAAGSSLLQRFARRSSWVRGKRVTVDDRYTGTTAGLTEQGFLLVTGDDGAVHTVRSGGVRPASS